ncbi:MAG: phospholipase [Flavobacteriales bacterium]|nr:MAG: phospholipase [Flavobacteriales bacterium]
MEEHHITVPRTARYHVLGDPRTAQAIWIVLHGYGQLARYFLNKFDGLAADIAFVAPEGLSRFYLDEGHQRVGATWMTREDREHEIADQCSYLSALTLALRGPRTGTPVNILGFSQGVATACRWSLQCSTPPPKLVLWAGSLPPEPSPDDLRLGWANTTVDLVLGNADPYADGSELRSQAERLSAAGVKHRIHRFSGGHTLEPILLSKLIR